MNASEHEGVVLSELAPARVLTQASFLERRPPRFPPLA